MDFTKSDYDLIDKEFEELRLAALKRCASQEEYDGVLKAFEFANEAHKGVRRRPESRIFSIRYPWPKSLSMR